MPTTKAKRPRKPRDPWQRNDIQFPRLLAEINAVGLTYDQEEEISRSTDLTLYEIDELFARAEAEFARWKARWKASVTRRQHAPKKPA